MTGAPFWTPEQLEIARRLMAAKATDAECWAAVGRSRRACYVRLARDHYVPIVVEPRRPPPPDSILEEADRRQRAPRSITAWICGDPPPGFSALDRRERA